VKETLHNARRLDETRVKRAFGWVVTFRDFPEGSWQVVGGDKMMTEALTLFTKGRAEFYLDGERRGDRVPGILSSEHDLVGLNGEFTLKYVEPTTRVCIFSGFAGNKNQLPNVSKIVLHKEQQQNASAGFKALVCLGEVKVNDKIFTEEKTFSVVSNSATIEALSEQVILLDFSNATAPSRQTIQS